MTPISDDIVERHAKSLADSMSYAWHDAAVRRKLRKISKAALTAALEGSVVVPGHGCGDPRCKDPNCDYGKEHPAFDRIAVIQECMDTVERLRILSATDFKDPKCAGQRGVDRTDAFHEAFHAIRALALPRQDRGGEAG